MKSIQQNDLFVLIAGILFNKLNSDNGKAHLEPARKSARNAKKRKNVSSSLYLGYVEDDESIDAIEKKFHYLEEYQKQKQTNETKTDNLSTEDLENIFKMTSSFTVEALDDENLENNMLSDSDSYVSSEQSDDSDDDFFNEYIHRDSERKGISLRGFIPESTESVLLVTNDANGNLKSIQKVKIQKPHTIECVKVPKLLPLSWAKHFFPIEPSDLLETSEYYVSKNIFKDDNLYKYTELQGILIDPPYHCIKPSDLLKFKNLFQKILKEGIIFIWSDKKRVHEICQVMESVGYFYVENVTWVKKTFNNKFVTSVYFYFIIYIGKYTI